MSHVVPSVPFPHYSLRFPLAEAFLELKAMEGWGQDATCLRCGALRHHQCARWMGVCVCVCLDLFLALHLCGQGQAGLQEPSALGLPCPCGACHSAWESVQALSWPSWPLLAGSWRRTGVT